jgi:hypothetical protein
MSDLSFCQLLLPPLHTLQGNRKASRAVQVPKQLDVEEGKGAAEEV